MQIELLKSMLNEFFDQCPQINSIFYKYNDSYKVWIQLNSGYYDDFEDWLHEELNVNTLVEKEDLPKPIIQQIQKAIKSFESKMNYDCNFSATREEIKMELKRNDKLKALCKELMEAFESQ